MLLQCMKETIMHNNDLLMKKTCYGRPIFTLLVLCISMQCSDRDLSQHNFDPFKTKNFVNFKDVFLCNTTILDQNTNQNQCNFQCYVSCIKS